MDGLLDPRGIPGEDPVVPARRAPSLHGLRVLLVDNGKLGAEYGHYSALWDVFARRLAGSHVSYFSDDLIAVSGADHGDLAPLADRLIAAERPDAAIIALADAGGVSFLTTRLALALEARGVPAAIVATPRGAVCVRAVCEARAPGIEPVALEETLRTDSAETIERLAERAFEAIERRLTQAPPAERSFEAPAGGAPAADWSALARVMSAYQDWAERSGLGDGLPLIPPTREAVAEHLQHVGDDPDDVLFGPAVTSGRVARVRDAAANAVMTAAPPRSFPVIVAALRAMARPDYLLHHGAVTTHASGNAVIYSGPGAERFGLWGGAGCLGPGFRGNASVGRAVALTVLHVFGARPGGADLTAFGSPAEFTYCLAEDVEASPWPSLADELGDGRPGVFAAKIEGPRNILEHVALTPRGLCEAFAASATNVGANNASVPGDIVFFINPEHACIFADAGWTRGDVAQALFDLTRIPRARCAGHGQRPIRPRYHDALDDLPSARHAGDIRIVVAGAPGPQSMVAPSWGFSRAQWHPVVTSGGS